MQAYQRSTAPGTITESGARNFQKSGTNIRKIPKSTKFSPTKSASFASLDETKETEESVARQFFLAHPSGIFSRADVSERLNLPVNHVCRLVFDLLDTGFIEVVGRIPNPRSGKSVEAVRLAPPPVMVVREQSLFGGTVHE